MKCIKAFISYSDEDRVIAGQFKNLLQYYCGYYVFLAHEDMTPASDFCESIIKSIGESDFFIPLISENFIRSPYTDQETGIAIAYKKKIIPIKLENVNPYGFISKYHALSLKKSSNGQELLKLVFTIGLLFAKNYKDPYSEKAKNSIVAALKSSDSFYISNRIIKLICNCSKFNKSQLEIIIDSVKNNSQVRESYGLFDLRMLLRDKYKIII